MFTMNLNKQLHILQSNQGPLVLIGCSEPPFKPDVVLKNPNGVQVRVTTSWFMGRDWRINNMLALTCICSSLVGIETYSWNLSEQ